MSKWGLRASEIEEVVWSTYRLTFQFVNHVRKTYGMVLSSEKCKRQYET